MSATAPVRVRRPAALRLPVTVPSRATPQPKQTILPRPHLVAVGPARSTAGRLPFVILVGAVLVGGLVAVLLLHMAAAQDAFRITGLQARLTALTDQEQQEARLAAADSSPAALEARAVALGMEPTKLTNFHRRPDGRAVGVETPYYVPPPAPPVTKKTAKTDAKAGKKTAKKGTAPTTPTTTKHHSPATPTTTTHHHPASPKPKKHQSGHSKP